MALIDEEEADTCWVRQGRYSQLVARASDQAEPLDSPEKFKYRLRLGAAHTSCSA